MTEEVLPESAPPSFFHRESRWSLWNEGLMGKISLLPDIVRFSALNVLPGSLGVQVARYNSAYKSIKGFSRYSFEDAGNGVFCSELLMFALASLVSATYGPVAGYATYATTKILSSAGVIYTREKLIHTHDTAADNQLLAEVVANKR